MIRTACLACIACIARIAKQGVSLDRRDGFWSRRGLRRGWLSCSVVAGAVAVGVNDSILWQHPGKCRGYPRSKRESEVDLVDVGMVDIDQLPRTERRGSREIRGGVEEWTGRLLGKGTSRDSICHPSI